MNYKVKSKIFRLSFIFAFLLKFAMVNGQEYHYVSFPDSNAVWSEVYWKPISESCPRWTYNKYALFNEDTVINGRSYHKLFHTNESKITRENSSCIGGIREDSLKRIIANSSMFHYASNSEVKEVLLFDFSVDVGDTVSIHQNNDSIVANVSVYEIVVVGIDTISINGSKRKLFRFNIPWTRWIEGIGSVTGLLFPSGDLPTNGMSNDLVCMHKNDTLLYYYSGPKAEEYDSCVPSFVISDVVLLPNSGVHVYPNPVSGEIVHFENLDFETFEFFDLQGHLIRKKNITNVREFELNVSNYTPGIYSYRLVDNGMVSIQGKLIIL